jgi:deoxyxylulose-5-phosphate synthase
MNGAKRLTTSAMIASIAAEGQRTRPAPFGHALAALGGSRPDIVGMTADLGKYTDLHIFAEAYPDRFYQMGMAEQLLMGAAAGMAHEGFVPFATTYAAFASRRAYDFICMAIAEEALDVKIVCALPGLTTGYGPSHQATDDLAIFRAMPNLTIVDPCDALEIEQAVPAVAAHRGPVYMRLLRGQVPVVLDEYDYSSSWARRSSSATARALIVRPGSMTMRALRRQGAGGRSRRCRRAARPRSSRSTRRRSCAARGPAGSRRCGEPFRDRRAGEAVPACSCAPACARSGRSAADAFWTPARCHPARPLRNLTLPSRQVKAWL